MFSEDKRRILLTLAVLLLAITLAAVPDFGTIGNKQSNKCMGYTKTKPGRNQASLSQGSCTDTDSNSVTLFAANGKGGPIVDKSKQPRCVTATGSKSGANVDGKKCKAVPKKGAGKQRRAEDNKNMTSTASANDTELPDFVLNPENYEWPPEQQWYKISNTSTEFEASELWKNGYGWCLQVTSDGFFRQYKCDPNNPNQNWFINYEPQPETPEAPSEAPVQPVVTPVATPVQQPPVQTGCVPRNCPSGQYQDQVTCECVCRQVTCPAGQVQQADCSCKCDNTCPSGQTLQADCSCKCDNTCPSGQTLQADCSCKCDNTCPTGQTQQADCSCKCDNTCPTGQSLQADCRCKCDNKCPNGMLQQNDCTCTCPNSCSGAMVQQPDCSCKCPNTCGPNERQDPNTCACICNKMCDPACQRLDMASCSCVCTVHCVIGKVQDPNTCECRDPCPEQCVYPKICDPYKMMCV